MMRCVGSFGHVLHMCLARESTACRDRVHRGLPYMTFALEGGEGVPHPKKQTKDTKSADLFLTVTTLRVIPLSISYLVHTF